MRKSISFHLMIKFQLDSELKASINHQFNQNKSLFNFFSVTKTKFFVKFHRENSAKFNFCQICSVLNSNVLFTQSCHCMKEMLKSIDWAAFVSFISLKQSDQCSYSIWKWKPLEWKVENRSKQKTATPWCKFTIIGMIVNCALVCVNGKKGNWSCVENLRWEQNANALQTNLIGSKAIMNAMSIQRTNPMQNLFVLFQEAI